MGLCTTILHCKFKNILPICTLKNTCPVLYLKKIFLVSKATLLRQQGIQSSFPLQIHNDVFQTADAHEQVSQFTALIFYLNQGSNLSKQHTISCLLQRPPESHVTHNYIIKILKRTQYSEDYTTHNNQTLTLLNEVQLGSCKVIDCSFANSSHNQISFCPAAYPCVMNTNATQLSFYQRNCLHSNHIKLEDHSAVTCLKTYIRGEKRQMLNEKHISIYFFCFSL